MTKSASIKNVCARRGGWAVVLLATSALCLPAQAQENDQEDIIIVTATKRAEKLTEVPIAISVMGAEDIDQTSIRELSEIAEYIPNVQISDGTDFRSVITIRGVGSSSRNIGFDSRVGVYVDGVYMGQSPSVNQELLDLERVEVLRGPQGMLFGKNTVAGAISLVTVKPSQDFYGQVSADLGNFNYREFKGMVNVPLGEKAAAKFSVSKTDRDGYVDNITTGSKLAGKDVLAYRTQLRLTPTENFEVNFSFDFLKSDNLALLGEPLSDFLGIAPITIAPEPRRVAFNIDPRDNRKVKGGMADMQYELPSGFTLKSITGYRDTRGFTQNATDYSPIDIFSIEYTDAFKQLTQEFQFISPDKQKFTYMAGLYYYHQKATTIRNGIIGQDFFEGFLAPFVAPAFGFNPATVTQGQLAFIANFVGFGPEGSLIFNRGDVTTESYAGYVNGSYDFNDRLTLGFGGRYSVEDKKVSWLLDGRNSGLFNIGSTGVDPTDPNPPVPSPLLNKRQDKFFSPAISLSYAVSDDANMYAKYSSGYKSGGFNLDFINADELAANNGLEFGKETVDSYELGFKGNFADGRFKLNLAAFLADYNNYQVNQFVDLGGGRTSIRITNAAQVRTQGIEVEMQLEVTDNLHLQGSLGLLDAKFDKFPGGGTAGADVSGNKLPSAPEFTASFSAIYTRNLPALNSMLLVRGDLTHSGGYFTTVNNVKSTQLLGGAAVPFGYIDKLTQLNGRIGIIPNNEKFSVFLWGRNLTNADGLDDTFRDFFGTITNKPIIGRTYGIGLTANF
jgi:iron complex outermembrane recepter protein